MLKAKQLLLSLLLISLTQFLFSYQLPQIKYFKSWDRQAEKGTDEVNLNQTSYLSAFYRVNYDNNSLITSVEFIQITNVIWKDVFSYNAQKKRTKSEHYINNKRVGYSVYSYDLKGNLVDIEIYEGERLLENYKYYYNADNSIDHIEKYVEGEIERYTYYIYENGIQRSQQIYDRNKKQHGFWKAFDEKKRVVRTDLYTHGILSEYATYTYNNKDQVIRTNRYTSEGQLKGYAEFTYHTNGEKFKESYFYPDGRPAGRWMVYDDKGKVDIVQQYDDQFRPSGIWLYYDDQERIIKREEYYEGVLDRYILYYYDGNGDQVREETYQRNILLKYWVYDGYDQLFYDGNRRQISFDEYEDK